MKELNLNSLSAIRQLLIKKLDVSQQGHHPYIIPDRAYSEEMGLLIDYVNPEYYQSFEII